MSNLEVKHTPAVAAVEAKPERWECDGRSVERLSDGRLRLICRNGDTFTLDHYGAAVSFHAIFSAILAQKDAAKPAATARPKRVIVTEIARGDAGGLVVGRTYDVLSWDSLGRPQVRQSSTGLWYLSNRPGEWDTVYSTFSKWIPADESVKS